jgi:hypothetical protein
LGLRYARSSCLAPNDTVCHLRERVGRVPDSGTLRREVIYGIELRSPRSSASKAGSLHRRAPGGFCPKEQMPRYFINITQGEQVRELVRVLIPDLRQSLFGRIAVRNPLGLNHVRNDSCLNKGSFGTKVPFIAYSQEGEEEAKGGVVTTLQAISLGAMLAWTPSLFVLAWLLREAPLDESDEFQRDPT